MSSCARVSSTIAAAGLSALLIATGPVQAFQARPKTHRFDPLVLDNPAHRLDTVAAPLATLSPGEPARTAWDGFKAAHGAAWSISLDIRTGAPLLVEGKGIPWAVDARSTAVSLATSLKAFAAANQGLLKADAGELVFDRDGSGQPKDGVWQIVFSRSIGGVPVLGERYVFTIGHGNLIAFGATRWSRLDISPVPLIDAGEAFGRLSAYMGLAAADAVKVLDKGTLQIAPAKDGSALVWRLVVRIDGEPGTWEAYVDAHDGAIRAFSDINDYAQARGGVFPVANDGIPPDGVEQPGYPMPFANVTIGASTSITSASGAFACTPGAAVASTTLAGPYIRVVDTCGPINQTVTCDADLDLGVSGGTDCAVPAGASPGNTHSARSGFYHMNRIAEHARTWLPSRTWLFSQLTNNVNLNQTCNAYWLPVAGTVNFFKSGGGCANTGELAGVFLHEWGHGMDYNDGGGVDNPSEAYADVAAFMSTHASCIGRGFTSANCGGYGDPCLDCTGIRDQDYAKHASNAPATPAGFLATNCPPGSGPCGKETHCEAHVGAQTLWDLATRDLPATGLDLATSWQLADRLWYQSRLGSGGNAYNCSLPESDGCSATSWFTKMRIVDDDDGNLANGTPHAAAIFAAFDRHEIACGAAGDAGNQSSTICPPLAATVLSAAPGASAAQLSWTPVPGAVSYNILRNDTSCAAGSTIVAGVAGTSYVDPGLANGFTEYYAVQAKGANPSCEGRLSNCQAVTPQPFAGVVMLDAAAYSCAGTITVSVTDGNIGASTAVLTIFSGTEPAGEPVTVTRIAPGSATYSGTLPTTSATPAANGVLSVVHGDTITASYLDVSDGQGGVNLPRHSTAGVDCIPPVISSVAASLVTGSSARVTWNTSEAASSVVHYGLAPPPSEAAERTPKVVAHTVDLAGLSECSTYVYAVESADAVGNAAVDNAAGSYYSFATVKNTVPSFGSTDTPVPVPDNTPAGAVSTVTVLDNKPVQGVKVKLTIGHTYDADLVITLLPPSGPPITLSSLRGGSSNNYIETVFDDAAATPISAGSGPFTGAFRPETPLAAAIGINAAGSWRLKVVDTASTDFGTIEDWTLTLTYPAAPCGPHAVAQADEPVSDACGTGGPGGGDGAWDPGELVVFKVSLNNDGTAPLTGVTATLTPTTPGVGMVDGTASFPVIPVGAIADSLGPHFAASLSTGLTCGTVVAFDVAIQSAQGSWNGGTITHAIGSAIPGAGTALNETFAAGIPATWTIVDGGAGGGAAATWTTANPGARWISSPLAAPVAMVDSDSAGNTGATQDEQLITPLMDFPAATTVTLDFDQFFRWLSSGMSEIGDVDVRSTSTAGTWVNVLRQQGASSPNPDHKTIDITPQAAGASSVQVRFRYYSAQFEWYWQLDNVRIDFTTPPTCDTDPCAAGPGAARPVADGSFGAPMRGSRANASGSAIQLTWDVTTCASTDYHVLYGPLGSVATSSVSGSACNLGMLGSTTWTAVPAGSLWFTVVGDNDAATEGTWGAMTSGERGGSSASGLCGMTVRDNSASCP